MTLCNTPIAVDSKYFFVKKVWKALLTLILLMVTVLFIPWPHDYCQVTRFMVFNAIFKNISLTSWRSVLLLEETGVLGENHRPATTRLQTLSHNVISRTPSH